MSFFCLALIGKISANCRSTGNSVPSSISDAAPIPLACTSCNHGAISARRFTVSSLFATNTTGTPLACLPKSESTLASAPDNLPASTTSKIKSTPLTAPVTVLLSERFSAVPWRVWKPGVSANTNCVPPRLRIPKMRCRVVCALREVILTFWPTRALSNVLLPTLGLPTMAIMPHRVGPVGSAFCADDSAGA